MNREELNKLAADRFSEAIPDPTAYPNKAELEKAIAAAESGDPVPAPPEQKSGGTTVVFKGCPAEPGCRSVRVGDDRFVIETPVEHVSSETVKALKALDGHDFEFSKS